MEKSTRLALKCQMMPFNSQLYMLGTYKDRFLRRLRRRRFYYVNTQFITLDGQSKHVKKKKMWAHIKDYYYLCTKNANYTRANFEANIENIFVFAVFNINVGRFKNKWFFIFIVQNEHKIDENVKLYKYFPTILLY